MTGRRTSTRSRRMPSWFLGATRAVLGMTVLLALFGGRYEAAVRGHSNAEAPDRARSLPAIDSAVTVAAVGDIMMGTTFPEGTPLPPHDGAMLFSEVSPILRAASIAFGNLEGPLLDGGRTTKCVNDTANCYAFRTPTRYGRYLADAGFDVLSIANNHAMDFGEAGRRSTIRVLDSLGIRWAGPPGRVAQWTVNGRAVAFTAFSYDDDSQNLNRLEDARRIVSALAEHNDIVIVSFHGGAEGAARRHVPDSMEIAWNEKRGHVRLFARAMVDAGADLVLGHGPHVVRGMEVYRDRLIAYSLGNFATWERFNLNGPNGVSCILEAHLAGDGRFLDGAVHPIIQRPPGGPRLDPSGAVIPILRRLSEEDFGPTAIRVRADGGLTP